jgi:hypothetical protein
MSVNGDDTIPPFSTNPDGLGNIRAVLDGLGLVPANRVQPRDIVTRTTSQNEEYTVDINGMPVTFEVRIQFLVRWYL